MQLGPAEFCMKYQNTNGAGWSSPVARQAHNLKVVGSNPTPATKSAKLIKDLHAALRGGVCVSSACGSTVEASAGEVLHIAS